jgi:hypothetical protein
MPLDTRIALGVQPLQLADPLAREGQVQNILASQAQQRAAGMQQQSAQMQMDQAQRQLQQDEDYVRQMTDAIGKNGGPSDMEKAARLMATHRNPQVSQQGVTMLQSLQRLDAARKAGIYGTPAPVIPNVGPAPGAMGSGTFGMDQNVPMFNQRNVPPLNLTAPAPAVNQLTPPAAAPVNQLGVTPKVDAIKALETRYAKLAQFSDLPGVKEQMTLLGEQYKALINQRNTAFAPIDASKYTPASLKAFNLSGDQSDLVAVTKAEKTIGTVSPADFTAASLAKYAESNDFKDLVRVPKDQVAKDDPNTTAAFREVDNAGNVTFYNKFGLPISTQKGAGKPSATFEKTKQGKAQLVKDLDQAIVELTDVTKDGGLIDQSTGSGAGRLYDVGAGFFGQAPEGAIAIGKLQPIADIALKMVPRFEGPQSNADTTSYKQAAGQLADPTLPTKIRKEAGKTVLRLMKSRKDQFTMVDTAPAATGVDASNPLLK